MKHPHLVNNDPVCTLFVVYFYIDEQFDRISKLNFSLLVLIN